MDNSRNMRLKEVSKNKIISYIKRISDIFDPIKFIIAAALINLLHTAYALFISNSFSNLTFLQKTVGFIYSNQLLLGSVALWLIMIDKFYQSNGLLSYRAIKFAKFIGWVILIVLVIVIIGLI